METAWSDIENTLKRVNRNLKVLRKQWIGQENEAINFIDI